MLKRKSIYIKFCFPWKSSIRTKPINGLITCSSLSGELIIGLIPKEWRIVVSSNASRSLTSTFCWYFSMLWGWNRCCWKLTVLWYISVRMRSAYNERFMHSIRKTSRNIKRSLFSDTTEEITFENNVARRPSVQIYVYTFGGAHIY